MDDDDFTKKLDKEAGRRYSEDNIDPYAFSFGARWARSLTLNEQKPICDMYDVTIKKPNNWSAKMKLETEINKLKRKLKALREVKK